MFLHDRDQYIAWQGQVFFVKFAHDGGGHFDEIGYFVQQSFINNGFTTHKCRGLFDLFDDGGFAFFFIEHDACFADCVKIFISRRDFYFWRVVGAQSAGDIASNDTRIFKRNDLIAK